MFARRHAVRMAALSLVACTAIAVASCSGGSVATTPVATPTPATTTTQSVPTSGGTLVLPTASNGQSASLSLAAGAPAGVSLTATSLLSAPAGAPTVSSVARTTAARATQAITGAVPFFFVTFSVSANLSAQFISGQSVSLVTGDPLTASYYAEVDDITASPATKLGTSGPATLTTGFANFLSGGGVTSPTLTAGHTYLIQFYYIPASGTASPTPTPTATATATATASASATPTKSPSPSPSPTASASPSPVPSYTFSSSTAVNNCTGACGAANLVVMSTGGLTINWSNPPSTAGPPLVAVTINSSSADSTANITPSGFPVFTDSGTVQAYFQSTSTTAVSFTKTPAFMYEFPGTTTNTSCSIYQYGLTAGGNTWNGLATAAVSSNAASFAAVTQTFALSTTPTYFALVCH